MVDSVKGFASDLLTLASAGPNGRAGVTMKKTIFAAAGQREYDG